MCDQIATDLIGQEVQFWTPNRESGESVWKAAQGKVRAATADERGRITWLIQEGDGFIHRYSDDEVSLAMFDEDVRIKAFPNSNAVHL